MKGFAAKAATTAAEALHVPTGTHVKSQQGRSQHKNRAAALAKLRDQLTNEANTQLDAELDRTMKEASATYEQANTLYDEVAVAPQETSAKNWAKYIISQQPRSNHERELCL